MFSCVRKLLDLIWLFFSYVLNEDFCPGSSTECVKHSLFCIWKLKVGMLVYLAIFLFVLKTGKLNTERQPDKLLWESFPSISRDKAFFIVFLHFTLPQHKTSGVFFAPKQTWIKHTKGKLVAQKGISNPSVATKFASSCKVAVMPYSLITNVYQTCTNMDCGQSFCQAVPSSICSLLGLQSWSCLAHSLSSTAIDMFSVHLDHSS